MVYSPPDPPTSTRTVAWWTAIALMVVGTLLAAVGGWFATIRILDPIYADSFETPGAVSVDLESGDHVIWIHVFSISDLFADNQVPLTNDIDLALMSVEGPDGTRLPLTDVPIDGSSPLSRGTSTFLPAADFVVETSGIHTVSVDDPEAGRAFVSTSWREGFSRGLPWLIATAIGTIMLIAGFIMWLVMLIRRSRSKRDAPPASVPSSAHEVPPPPPAPRDKPDDLPTPW